MYLNVARDARQSALAKVDLASGRVVRRLEGVGTKAHCLVAWRASFLVLDSEEAALIRVDPANGSITTLYKVRASVLTT